MTTSHGYRHGTRRKFARGFGNHGMTHMKSYLTTYKVGDLVDIKVNSSQQKGMPHYLYHGKTGRVYDVTPHAVGVAVNKRVGNRIIIKRMHIRPEHLSKSGCRLAHVRRVQENERIKRRHDFSTPIKRVQEGPRRAFVISRPVRVTITPMAAKHYYD